ncbi:MAG: hypothetical protein IPJ17_15555 [Holophagales bacterium]|nr:MAG: hypothetical protein IPJ17_15555 [Holophagales bacterium]
MSRQGLRPIAPAIFHFVDGKLYFQHTRKAFDRLEKDERRNARQACAAWPARVRKKAARFRPGPFDAPVR